MAKISLKEHEAIEKKETPEFEGKEHSKHFLAKAAKMAGKHETKKEEKKRGKHKKG